MGRVYDLAKSFLKRYPGTIAWRIRAHSKVIERILNKDEEVYYAFAAQKNDNAFDMISTCVVALTNQRIIIAQKRVIVGYLSFVITPDMFNDMEVKAGFVWGKLYIDTIKEVVALTNISKGALNELQEKLSTYMVEQKKKFYSGAELAVEGEKRNQ